MKKIILALFLASTLLQSYSQTVQTKNTYFKLSGGRVVFGTGDFLGYSFAFDLSKNVIKKSSWGLAKLLLGGEFIFENGTKNPVIQDPTLDEFFGTSFQHVSNAIVWAKASYYPLKKIVSGFNIQLGPTFGYSQRSSERAASRFVYGSGNSFRQSTLSFKNGFVVGYRISTGIEFSIPKKFLAGFRLDFSNNNDGDINTLAGLKVGIKL